MLANEVLPLLRVTRQTLTKYVRDGKIHVQRLPNGRYDYSIDDVYRLFNANVQRKTYIYARVSPFFSQDTLAVQDQLQEQVELIQRFCFSNGYQVSGVFQDIASGVNFHGREEFFRMTQEILQGRVERVIVTYKDRISRDHYDLVHWVFEQYHCELISMNEIDHSPRVAEEMQTDIVDLFDAYLVPISARRKNQLARLLVEHTDHAAHQDICQDICPDKKFNNNFNKNLDIYQGSPKALRK